MTEEKSRRRISRWPVVLAIGGLAVALALVYLGARLAANPAAPPDLSHPGTVNNPRQVSVIMHDYVFSPNPLYLVPGETVDLNVFNGGVVPHELVLGDATVQQAWSSADAAATPPGPLASAPPASVPPGTGGVRVLLDPGEQQAVAYNVPLGQGLALLCHLPGHVERGMIGTVILAP